MSKKDAAAERDRLLKKNLARIGAEGWGQVLQADPALQKAFPGGVPELIGHFADWADRQMEARLKKYKLEKMRVRDRVTLGVRTRLEILAPYEAAVRKETAYLTMHQPALASKLIWRSADLIWFLAGDTATDFNHYTKRGLLVAVLTATTLYWLNDHTPDKQESWAFLDRRIENVMVAGKKIAEAKSFFDPEKITETLAHFNSWFRR